MEILIILGIVGGVFFISKLAKSRDRGGWGCSGSWGCGGSSCGGGGGCGGGGCGGGCGG